MVPKMIKLVTACCLVAYINCQGFGEGGRFGMNDFGGNQFGVGNDFGGQGFGDLPPDIQEVLNREIPGNGNGEFIALGGAGIGERHSNGLRNGWDGNPATRGMQTTMQGGFQQDPMLGDFGHGHGMTGGQFMHGGFHQNQFDVLPMQTGQSNIDVPFVDGMATRFNTFPTGPFLTPGQENFVPISSVIGGNADATLGGYHRRHNPKKPTISSKKETILPKKPVVTPKKSVTFSKKSHIQNENPFYPKQPVNHPKNPIIHPKKPIIHHKRPIINTIKPIIHPKSPIIRQLKPVISPKMPMNYHKKPAILPITYPKEPIMHTKKSPIYPKKPAMKPFRRGSYGRKRTRGGY